jgi:phosphatidate cytidylyltransferase
VTSHAQRLITALVLAPLLVWVILAGGWWLFGAALLASCVGLWEYYSLFWPGLNGLGKKVIGLALAGLFFYAAKTENPHLIIAVLVFSFWSANLFFLYCYSRRPGETFYANPAILVSGLLYLPFVLQFPLFFSPQEIFLVFLATIASDAGGFYTGRAVGRHKIWPAISPNKTWEGSFGGLVACVVVCLAFGLVFGSAGALAFALLGVALNVADQLGDFFESGLKRRLNVKDSGTILPGHGGLLDRIDGLLLVIPVYAAARQLHPFFTP